ncbi:SDR family NAD(P)-dependent oxidoreductase [Okibacterium endophyticum]
MTWTVLPQHGRVIAVTGGNAGLGFWTSLQLAEAGASVVLCCRNREKADAARAAILRRVPDAVVSVVDLDLADLGSVRRAGEELAAFDRLDVLIENAGVVHVPVRRRESVDGIEFVLATNYVGHVALTAHAMPALERTPGARVVTLGSLSTLMVQPRLDDLQLRRHYDGWTAYARSKVATQSFGFELDRRLREAGSHVRSVCAHPGYSISGRSPAVPGVKEPSLRKRFVDNLQWPFAQGKDRGAWPIVRAATDTVQGGEYVGPLFLMKGRPVLAKPNALTLDRAVAAAFWAEAERVAGVRLL